MGTRSLTLSSSSSSSSSSSVSSSSSSSSTWRKQAQRAKRLHRPSLSDWSQDGWHAAFPQAVSSLIGYRHFRLGSTRFHDVRIPVLLEASQVGPREFQERFESHGIPAVIRGITSFVTDDDNATKTNYVETVEPNIRWDGISDVFLEEKKECDHHTRNIHHAVDTPKHTVAAPWSAIHKWSLASLSSDRMLRSHRFKVGEDDDGNTVRMKLSHFLHYLHHNTDDSPLYIFDSNFDESRHARRLLQDYTVPSYFDEDLLGLVGERRRPPYRWFLVGPQRSGTTVHVDPLGTSAWNTLIVGEKRWVLFPPWVKKGVVKGKGLVLKGEEDEAIHYFLTILPRIKRRAAMARSASGNTPSDPACAGDYDNFECFEFTQYAGETVFIPHGWWHAVLNVTHTVGITQNYCSRRNFDAVWVQTRSGRKKMACTWLRRLKDHYPELERRAKELNQRDRFIMWEDDPVEQRRWREKKARKAKKRQKKEDAKRLRESRRQSKKDKWGEHRIINERRIEQEK